MKKRSLLSLLAILFIASTMVFTTSCGEEDTEAPVITLLEPDNNYIVFGEEYTDPGAEATDNDDKEPTVIASGEIDGNYAGEQTITYTATDKDGNSSTLDRIVTVDAAPYLEGTFDVNDDDGTVPVYTSHVTKSSSTYNKVYIDFFAYYDGAEVEATFEGLNIIIPEQDLPSVGTDNEDRTFKGSGTFTAGKTLTISYEVWFTGDPSSAFSGSAVYTIK